MTWHRTIKADVTLRAGGALLLCLAGLAARHLFGAGARVAAPLDYGLAAIGFAAASIGSALLWTGRHLFDQIELSPRWTIYARSRARSRGVRTG